MAEYEFVTVWQFEAPQERVWELIFHSERWPDRWPGVKRVVKIRDGDSNHVGSVHQYTWKSKLPYRLVFEMESVCVEPPLLLEGRAIGELQGFGRWTLSQEGDVTTVRYDWQVETTKAWIIYLLRWRALFSSGTTTWLWVGVARD